jgi:hypothetical protein
MLNDMKFEIPASSWITWVDSLFYLGKWISIRLQKIQIRETEKKATPGMWS